MKKIILTSLLGGIAAFVPQKATAADRCSPYPYYNYYAPAPVHYYYVAPVRVSTREIDRSIDGRLGRDACGNRYTYYVTTITYRDYYSDGSTKTYTRAFRG